jgi:hypothetical protein
MYIDIIYIFMYINCIIQETLMMAMLCILQVVATWQTLYIVIIIIKYIKMITKSFCNHFYIFYLFYNVSFVFVSLPFMVYCCIECCIPYMVYWLICIWIVLYKCLWFVSTSYLSLYHFVYRIWYIDCIIQETLLRHALYSTSSSDLTDTVYCNNNVTIVRIYRFY